MKKRTRLAATILAAATLTGAGAAAAAPAFAADNRVTLYGFPTKGICQVVEQATGWAINASGHQVYAGDACGYWGPDKLYGFSMLYN
ncbi:MULTISPECIES: hypothetical protein [Microbacterium]|uniref:Uncharacterized protein n=1 Tax=Microbacterium binotii TaxID=462710 RepID=A0ABN3PCV3_9MICO|nr:hypothetical protein [Microbacterium sp. CIAB417]